MEGELQLIKSHYEKELEAMRDYFSDKLAVFEREV
jgi:hypothetical protein